MQLDKDEKTSSKRRPNPLSISEVKQTLENETIIKLFKYFSYRTLCYQHYIFTYGNFYDLYNSVDFLVALHMTSTPRNS